MERVPAAGFLRRKRAVAVSLIGAFTLAATYTAAFFDENTRLDLDRNGSVDVVAYSDYLGGPGIFFRVKDWVWVARTESFNTTGLDFDWQISDGHLHRGELPLPNSGLWSSYNEWKSYRVETHGDFTLELKLKWRNGPSEYAKTAPGHDPSLVIDSILGGLFAAGGTAETEGSYGFAEEIGGAETPVLKVWSNVTDMGDGRFRYQYWVRNFSPYAVAFTWAGTSLVSERCGSPVQVPAREVGSTVSPGATVMLRETIAGEPFESNASVRFTLPLASGPLAGAFFAPMIHSFEAEPCPAGDPSPEEEGGGAEDPTEGEEIAEDASLLGRCALPTSEQFTLVANALAEGHQIGKAHLEGSVPDHCKPTTATGKATGCAHDDCTEAKRAAVRNLKRMLPDDCHQFIKMSRKPCKKVNCKSVVTADPPVDGLGGPDVRFLSDCRMACPVDGLSGEPQPACQNYCVSRPYVCDVNP